MTQNEKKYFVLNSTNSINQNKIYISLYKDIEQMETYNEEFLKNKYKNSYGGNFGMLKENLFNQILNSLKQYYRDSSIENKILTQTEEAKILLKKGLIKLAEKKIDKVIDLSIKYERFTIILHLFSIKKSIYIHSYYEKITENKLTELINKQNIITKTINNINELNDFQLFYFLYESQSDFKKMQEIVVQIENLQNKNNYSFAEKSIKYNILSHNYRITNQLDKAISLNKKHIKLFEENYFIKSEFFNNYLLQNYNYISLLILKGAITDAKKKLQNLYLKEHKSSHYRHLFYTLYFNNIFLIHCIENDIDSFNIEFKNMHKIYKKLKISIPFLLIKVTFYYEAVLYFNDSNYKNCIQKIQINFQYIYKEGIEFNKFLLLLLLSYIKLEDISSLIQCINLYKKQIKYLNESFIEDSFIKLIIKNKLLIVKENRVNFSIDEIKSKPSNKDLYFPLNIFSTLFTTKKV